MDSLNPEHSDSDSCESWTLLESNPSYGVDVLDIPGNEEHHGSDAGLHLERDDDTDGISIISDSDHEPSTPCVHLSHEDLREATDCAQDTCPTDEQIPQCPFEDVLASNTQNSTKGSAREDEVFLANNTGKLRTYVHKRNKRLSTVLNIIVLGSIITAAGVAIGHMWGVRDDCLVHSTPSVNKILSSLYKLQEENAYLRSKIKELTMLNNASVQKVTKHMKQQRCKKVFEESLTSENVDKLTKCVEYEDVSPGKGLESHMIQPQYERDFLSDIDKLKHVYQQNKSWLDEEIARRQKNEKHSIHKIRAQLKNLSNEKSHKYDEAENLNLPHPTDNLNDDSNLSESSNAVTKKISYADSLKSEYNEKRRNKRDSSSDYYRQRRDHGKKCKLNNENEWIPETAMSDDDIRKDDRYNQMKHKYDKKKDSHQKLYKKQKRRNKYEQWEMKGGYMKDYDDISVDVEPQENGFVLVNNENKPNRIELNNYTQPLVNDKKKDGNRVSENVDVEHCRKEARPMDEKARWYERRATQRMEARRRLERELFEREPSAAAWYFRRMQRRERTQPHTLHPLPTLDNKTRKNSKRQKNYKTKH